MGMLTRVVRERNTLSQMVSLQIFQVCSNSNFGNFGVDKICQFGNLRLYDHLAIFGNLVTVANFGNWQHLISKFGNCQPFLILATDDNFGNLQI